MKKSYPISLVFECVYSSKYITTDYSLYRVFSEFLYTFVFAAIFLFEFYRRTIKGKKYAPDKVEKRKNP